MSVYTVIEQDELTSFLDEYDVGSLTTFAGISDGIENTNYFVDTTGGRFVLTIFEHHSYEEMKYFLNLMHHLADHDVPSADPVADRLGHYLRLFPDSPDGKPIALVERLKGSSIDSPTVDHCRQLGDAMGRMHKAGLEFDHRQDNPRGPAWCQHTARKVMGKLDNDLQKLLEAELVYQREKREAPIPRGVVHADLFRDNALWDTTDETGHRFSGIIDFYYSCDDVLLYDLAVTANDWCIDAGYRLDRKRVVALLESYHQHRPLTPEEQEYWPAMLRAAALRFLLSRLHDLHFPRPGELVTTKDPDEFRAIITDRIEYEAEYRDFWPTKQAVA